MSKPVQLFVSSSPGLAPERETVGQIVANLRDMPHSPSAQRLLHRTDLAWTTFQTSLELKRELNRALAEAILDQGERLGLHVHEVQALPEIAESEEEGKPGETDRRRGAGQGAVILARGNET